MLRKCIFTALALAVGLVAGACSDETNTQLTEPDQPGPRGDYLSLLPPGAELPPGVVPPEPSPVEGLFSLGAFLAQFPPPVRANGRGLAFDGSSLFYSLAGSATIFEVSTAGGPLINSFVNASGRAIGALAWDPTGLAGSGSLWAGTYEFSPAVIVELHPTTGAVLTTISAIPGDGPFPTHLDGLAFDPATNALFYSTDLGPTVFEIAATGGPAALMSSFPIAGGDLSGHAFDGKNLYSSSPIDGFSGGPNPFPAPQVYVTDLTGAIAGNFSSAPLQGEDLAFDGVTFAPLCAIWMNNASGANSLSAFEVDCPNNPPVCTAAAPDVDALWPPNHKFATINVLGVTDPDGDAITINIDAIRQDEPTDTFGDGNFTPDGQGVGTSSAEVRAERTGTKAVPGNGRVYHISFTATDTFGASCSGTVLVGVPHDQRGDAAVDDGPLFDSTI